MKSFGWWVGLLVAGGVAGAQEERLTRTQEERLLEVCAEVPIFAGAATSEGRAETRYAVRKGYKVELERSFSFVPFLGAEAPRNLPLRWTTQAIRRDGAPLAQDACAGIAHEAWRYEVHQPGFVERYDLRAEGLELSWVLGELPEGSGDLFVEGRIETPTQAERRGFEHGALLFTDERGELVLTFGAALAYDARGRRIDVPTSWDGETARLRVPADWLASAELPIVIDPLVSGSNLSTTTTSRPLSSIDLVTVDTAINHKLFAAFTIAYSATDHDLYGVMMYEDLSVVTRVLADVTTANSDLHAKVAFNESASAYLVASQRNYSSAAGDFSGIRLYFHDRDSLVENSGLMMQLEGGGTASLSHPDLGGSDPYYAPTSRVLLVYQVDVTTSRADTANSEIYARPVDLASRTPLATYRAGAYSVGLSYDRAHASVSPVMGTTEGWLLTFLEIDRSVSGDDWDVRGTITHPDGTLLYTNLMVNAGGQRHCLYPRVAGRDGRYLLVYGRSPALNSVTANELFAQRIDWPAVQIAPSFPHPSRLVDTVSTSVPGFQLAQLSDYRGGFDRWALGYLRGRFDGNLNVVDGQVLELGSTGGAIYSSYVFRRNGESSVAPAISSVPWREEWRVLAGSSTTYRPIESATLELLAGNIQMIVGGCGGSVAFGTAVAGNAEFFSELQINTAGRPAVMILGLLPTLIPLGGIGMNNCTLGLDPNTWLATFSHVTDGLGHARQMLPLPDAPVFRGSFCTQWVHAAPGANALGLRITSAHVIQID